MIVKIGLAYQNGESDTMLFGDSYKDWDTQFEEYCRIYKPIQIKFLSTSQSKWKGWGGLKWCLEKDFQLELNREGCQTRDPDCINPRIYTDMEFKDNPIALVLAEKILKHISH